MVISLFLSTALICFGGACHPVLVGADTPTGTFPLTRRIVVDPGYGGDVLQFAENEREWFALHRTYRNLPDRVAAYSAPADGRRYVTNGCVNLTPEVYDELAQYGGEMTLVVMP